jgi:hypothetical protein
MRTAQGIVAAVVVGSVFTLYLVNFLGAGWPFAISSSLILGFGIVAVVVTRTSDRDVLADEAWRAGAPDLPPASDRRAMEDSQSAIPGPEKSRPAGRASTRRGTRSSEPGDVPGR